MKKLFFVLFFLISALALSAQSKFQINLDYHYSVGFLEKSKNYMLKRNDLKMHGNSLRLVAFYALSKRFNLGAGIGADRCEQPGYNTFPVFVATQFSPIKGHLPYYFFSNLGYALKSDNAIRGAMWEAGAGYKHMFRKHFGLKADLGYSMKNLRQKFWDFEQGKDRLVSSVRHSVNFGVGVIF